MNNISGYFFRYSIFFLLMFFCFIIGYFQTFLTWMSFIPPTILILFLTKKFFPDSWQELLGLKFGGWTLLFAFILFFIMNFNSVHIIQNSLLFDHSFVENDFFRKFGIFFQCLNEEMIFRAFLLTVLFKIVKQNQYLKIITCILIGFLFGYAHELFYQNSYSPANRGGLSASVLAAIVAFGILSNILFMKYRNIAYSMALHFAWNSYRFSLDIYNFQGEKLSELQSYQVIEARVAAQIIVISVLGMMVLYFHHLWKKLIIENSYLEKIFQLRKD